MNTITAILEPAPDGTLHLPGPWSPGRFRVRAEVQSLDELSPMPEHTVVSLRRDLSEDGMKAGAKGTIVHVYEGGAGYEVEFTRSGGIPKVVTVESADIEAAE